MNPMIDFLDSVTFSSTVNHFITFVITGFDFHGYLQFSVAFLTLVCSFIGVRVQ